MNRRIRGAVVGALMSTNPVVQQAAFGYEEEFNRYIDTIKAIKDNNDNNNNNDHNNNDDNDDDYIKMITDITFSAAAGGLHDILLKIIIEFPFCVNCVDLYGINNHTNTNNTNINTNTNTNTNTGRTALMLASQGDHKTCIHYLLRHRADPNAYCSNRWSALCYGASSLSVESARY